MVARILGGLLMAESFVQLPADSVGKKLRARSRVIGANTVYEQAFFPAAIDSWIAYADAVAFAASKHHLTIFNATGSGVTVKVRKLYAVNLATSAAVGIVQRFDIRRATASSAGTTITPVSQDTNNTALPAGVTVRTNGTVTNGSLLFPWITSTEEETAAVPLSKTVFQQAVNIIPEGPEVQEITLRANNEGMTVHQTVSSTVGSFGWIIGFTVEAN